MPNHQDENANLPRYGSPSEGDRLSGEPFPQFEEHALSPDVQETPGRGTWVNMQTGEVEPFLSNGPDTEDWVLLSPDPNLTLERAKELVAMGGVAGLLPDQLH